MKAISLEQRNSLFSNISIVAAFSIFMALAAYIRIPLFFTPVPLTLQTLVVYISLVALKRKAPLSQILYLLVGASGLSVFTNGGAGFLYLLGPTGGYLIGFLLVALVFPYLIPAKISFAKAVLFFTSAAFLIYLCGLGWLIFVHRLTLPIALVFGLYPFVAGEVIKIAVASLLALKLKA